MKCADCRWFHKENEICLKDGCSVFGIYIDDECEYVNNMTVFEKITASPEVLAEKFIFKQWNAFDAKWGWFSLLLMDGYTIDSPWFESYEEAIAATVTKLKEVEK